MDKITFVTDVLGEEHVIIEHAEGAFTSMRKSTYDAMQAEQSTPSVTNGD
jgi:hypothetical protein